ncbi:putative protein phosphatase 2C 33 [Zea mays]|uniref:protein-serine/threonine phosphatase n=1 Tax=Zea mays TaxID=4577 RepID=A0A1D6I0Z7_MAIZE|nr:putative protein phosphatase 2C 33 [Zea mays]
MLRAFDDYYIEDCGVILASEVMQRRIDNSDQFVILATVRHMWNVLSNDETIQIVAYIEVCMILMVAM